jgi:D-amino-acid dehydrogenase
VAIEGVLVIGGGVIGVCTAYYLAEAGHEVTVLEREEQICPASASSYGNAGIICPSDVVPLAAPGVLGKGMAWMLDDTSPFFARPRADLGFARWLALFRAACTAERARQAKPALRALGVASRALYDELVAGHEADYGFSPTGWITVCTTRDGLDESRHEAAETAPLGVVSEMLDAAELRRRVPGLTADAVGAVFNPENAFVDPRRFVRGLRERAAQLGARFVTEAEVLGFRAGRGRVQAAVTTRGEIPCRQVVLAAGVDTPALARTLAQRGTGTVPLIEPGKGYSIDLPRTTGAGDAVLYLYEGAICVTPFAEILRVAGTLELTGFDRRVNRRRVEGIRRAAARYLPETAGVAPLRLWRGLRPLTPDGLPFIDRLMHLDNVLVAAGHCMMGITYGPATGKLVAQLIAGDEPLTDPRPFRLDRFGLLA